MDILSSITAILSTLKSGFEIKKLAGNLDSEVQQGELRVEIRKLQESLIDVQDVLLKAKKEILDNREIIQEKDAEIRELKNLIDVKPLDQSEDLSDEFIKVLRVLVQDDNVTAAFISRVLQISEQKVKYYLDSLIAKDLVNRNIFSLHLSEGSPYYLSENGRKFMFEKDLL